MSLAASAPAMAFAAGLAAGAVHVLSGPDHLAAVAPLAAAGRGLRPALVGLRWGLGHAAGVLLIGGIAFALRGLVDPHLLSGWGERAVGAVLVLVGLWGLRRASSRWVHAHPHAHGPDGAVHVHVHVHKGSVAREHEVDGKRGQSPGAHVHRHAPFLIGTLHGLAGATHLLGIVPALALPSRALTVLYVSGFAAGTVAAMAAFSLGVGLAASRVATAARGGERAYRLLLGAASVAAVVVGVAWIARA
jgi:hypothetical protein